MILAPSAPPPSFPPQEPLVADTPSPLDVLSQPTIQTATARLAGCSEMSDSLENLKIPHVLLKTRTVTHTMAATLGMSLLGHILFLKSQVPFPVVQLVRMPGGQSDSRAAKRRNELLAAIDTLSSHMQTTFAALSTAFARKKSVTEDRGSTSTVRLGTAYLAFVVGPSVGAARARVIYTVDGMEVKVWGEREDGVPRGRTDDGKENERGVGQGEGSKDGECEDEEEDSDETNGEESEGSEEEDGESCEDEDSDAASEDDDGSDVSETASEPPPSRSPSPSLSPEPAQPRSGSSSPPRVLSATTPISATIAPPSLPHSLGLTFAEEQQALRAAERLLSRTLANACAEDSGGMSSELSPTQTHILLRAPRRFTHPAWIPRQNLTRSLEGMLQSFLDDASPATESAPRKRSTAKGPKTEGVWVGCHGSDLAASLRLGGPDDYEESEDDEMIWWAWNGKIVGFSDW